MTPTDPVAVDELHLRSERAQLALRNAIAALDAATKEGGA